MRRGTILLTLVILSVTLSFALAGPALADPPSPNGSGGTFTNPCTLSGTNVTCTVPGRTVPFGPTNVCVNHQGTVLSGGVTIHPASVTVGTSGLTGSFPPPDHSTTTSPCP